VSLGDPPSAQRRGASILSIDVGTTTVKAGLFDGAGVLRGLGRQPQRNVARQVGWQEHDPEDTWRAVFAAVQEALRSAGSDRTDVAAIAVTGPRGTFAATGRDGHMVTNFITWQDQRAAERVAACPASLDSDSQYDITGSGVDASTVLPKYLWLRANRPDVASATAHLVTPQGFVLSRLGAEQPSTDTSVAAHFALLDIHSEDWSPRLLSAFAIDRSILPPLVRPGANVGATIGGASDQLGLSDGVALVAAGSDGICSELGAGVVAMGQVYGYLGTATAVAGPTDRLSLDPQRQLIVMPGSVPGRWRGLGLAMAGASALDWFGRVSGPGLRDNLTEYLGSSPPGARGVRFIPTLAGSGSAFPSGQARGSFVGLSLSTSRADMARAVLEGVALELRWMATSLSRLGIEPTAVHLTGGGSRSDGWAQVIADATQLEVARVDHPEPGLLGASLYGVAALRTGASVLDVAGDMATPATVFQPRADVRDVYDEAAQLYARTRRALVDSGIDAALFQAGNA
jgi:xylulokinase